MRIPTVSNVTARMLRRVLLAVGFGVVWTYLLTVSFSWSAINYVPNVRAWPRGIEWGLTSLTNEFILYLPASLAISFLLTAIAGRNAIALSFICVVVSLVLDPSILGSYELWDGLVLEKKYAYALNLVLRISILPVLCWLLLGAARFHRRSEPVRDG